MGGKITINLKELHKKRKEKEKHAYRKRARNALNTERTLELREWCTTFQECSVRLDKGRKSDFRRKTNRRKMNPTVRVLNEYKGIGQVCVCMLR
jgi:hypothetical protein